MPWKTDEKALLEKRGEDRGKLMLTGRSVTKTSHRGWEVSVHMDRHASCFGMPIPIKLELWVPPEMGISLMRGIRCDQKDRHTPSDDMKATGAKKEGFSWVLAIPSSPGLSSVMASGGPTEEKSLVLGPVYTCCPSGPTLLGQSLYPEHSLSGASLASSGSSITQGALSPSLIHNSSVICLKILILERSHRTQAYRTFSKRGSPWQSIPEAPHLPSPSQRGTDPAFPKLSCPQTLLGVPIHFPWSQHFGKWCPRYEFKPLFPPSGLLLF